MSSSTPNITKHKKCKPGNVRYVAYFRSMMSKIVSTHKLMAELDQPNVPCLCRQKVLLDGDKTKRACRTQCRTSIVWYG